MNQEILERIGQEEGEYHIYGPPGTGKTTTLSRVIEIAQGRFGGDAILVTSFSKAAARELVARNLPIHPDHVGTLHHHCFQALGGPRIVETIPELVARWNQEHYDLQIEADHRLRKSFATEDESGENEDFEIDSQGEGWLPEINRLRGGLIDPLWWSGDQRRAFALWQEFKQSHNAVDFVDLIEHALRDFKIAPGNPRVIFVDECQDLVPMQLALVRQWGRHCDYSVLAFDDDQAIYVFTGVDPKALLANDIPESHKLVLGQSYRLARAIHRYANGWIRRLGDRRREKQYQPRESEGQLIILDSWGNEAREEIFRQIESELASGRKVMLLASCAFLLQPLTRRLKEAAIPFFNPYRLSHNGWNPLHVERPLGPAARLRALLRPAYEQRRWRAPEFALWTEPMLGRGNFQPGAKERIALLAPGHEIGFPDLNRTFTEETIEGLLLANQRFHAEGDCAPLAQWWHARLGARSQKSHEMAVRIGARHGPGALSDPPKLIVGTIHSVKGGEADTVILLPDVSTAIENPEDVLYEIYPDEIIRTFYVGMTRARERLYLAGPTTKLAVRWPSSAKRNDIPNESEGIPNECEGIPNECERSQPCPTTH